MTSSINREYTLASEGEGFSGVLSRAVDGERLERRGRRTREVINDADRVGIVEEEVVDDARLTTAHRAIGQRRRTE